MSKDKILILGGTGFLGSYFTRALSNVATIHTTQKSHVVTSQKIVVSRFNQDRLEEVDKFIEEQNCTVVINCIALTEIEKCEQQPELAYWLNSELPGYLSSITRKIGAKFIHFSTDAVFDGSRSFVSEREKPSPISVYGKSKFLGENMVMEKNDKSLIVRVNFFGRNPNGQSLFDYFHRNLLMEKEVHGFADVFFTPLYAGHLVEATMNLISLNENGLFHIVGDERISKYEFGVLVGEAFGFPKEHIRRKSIKDSVFSNYRSTDLSLSNLKYKSLGAKLPTICEGLSDLKANMH